MPHKGHFGVSMGAIVRRPRKVDKQSRNCFNCKFMDKRRNNCSKIRKNTEGQSSGYVSPGDQKSMATNCMHFDNVHPQQGKKTNSGNTKTNSPHKPPKTALPKSDLATLRQVQWDRIDEEIAKFKAAKQEGRVYVSGAVFKMRAHSRKIVDISISSERVKYVIHSGPQKGLESICDLTTFKNEIDPR